jgi:alcohol dehydrogenase (NADP+)
MELHPHFQQPEFFKFCIDNQIAPIGFAPIGSPTRPDRDKTPDDTVDIEDPVIVKIAERLNVHPAVVCVKWAVQRGQIPIPFSIYPDQYWSNLKAATTEPLTDEEMQEIAGIDKNNRLIKGQVFLWESAKDWQDLWDLDGQIVSA